MTRADAKAIRTLVEAGVDTRPDEEAGRNDMRKFSTKWRVGVAYEVNKRVRYGGVLYKCLQAHTSQSDWTPIAAPSLWAEVLIEDPDVISAWKQPDSTNPYMKGDKVYHNSKTWISTCDNNVWEPGVYGWEEVTEASNNSHKDKDKRSTE